MSQPNTIRETIDVTGLGAVSPAGLGTLPLWQNVLQGNVLCQNGLGPITSALEAEMTTELGLAEAPPRFLLMARHAIAQAMRQAGWESLREDDGLILGTTTANVLVWESGVIEAGARNAAPEALVSALRKHEPMGVTLRSLAAMLDFRGPARLVTTACSSSTQAIALGAQWLKSGRVKRCLVGGAEVLSRLTVEGFRCLQLLSQRPATPFDAARAGINLSEGAAFLCLEKSGAKPLAQLSGWGLTSDAHHLTAPHPEGRGCYEAMQIALAMAAIPPSEIGWVYAHGTGSLANDLAEGIAIRRLFGEAKPFVSSTKGCHGHSLAASGALESVLLVQALRDRKIPVTTGLSHPDPAIEVRHPLAVENLASSHVVKNSLGFGGANASLVWSGR